ncbi:MAG: eukaryotic-like serine/threonine-protein kinase [Actinomycetota bacterium]|jgi:serine/threonine protein kinase
MADHLKIAVGDEGVERLRNEAAVLEAVRHPGIVELLGFTDEGGVAELRTAEVDGPSLAGSEGLAQEEVAGLAAAIATTVADLHDAGVVHGALDASHVLLGSTGPVLCGFGAAGPPGVGRQPTDDVDAVGRLVLELVDRGPVAEVARGLGPCTAREAAAAFRACIATAILPGRSPAPQADGDALADLLGRGRIRRRSPRSRLRWAAVPLVVVLIVLVMVTLRAGDEPVASAAFTPTTTAAPMKTTTTERPAPTATLVWPPATGPAPTIVVGERRFSVGRPGDLALAGPFGCGDSTDAAAVLRPSSGQVFVFPEAATPDHDTTGVEVAVVAGAVALDATDSPGGCRELVVQRSNGPAVPVGRETAP